MAQVAQSAKLRAWIDDYVDYLLREWEGIPELAAEWHEWDEYSRFSFAMDWPIREDRLHQLRQWAKQGLLTDGQQARYDQLLKLIATQRPTLERLLEE